MGRYKQAVPMTTADVNMNIKAPDYTGVEVGAIGVVVESIVLYISPSRK